MKKIIMLLAMGILVASVAAGATYEKKWGFTMMNANTPLGVAFGMGKDMVLRVGVGFDHTSTGGTSSVSGTAWDVMVALDHACMGDDDNNLTIGPFAGYNKDGDVKFFEVGAQLGAEHWFGKRLSVNVHQGVMFQKYSNSGPSSFSTFGDPFGNAGFTLWWGK